MIFKSGIQCVAIGILFVCEWHKAIAVLDSHFIMFAPIKGVSRLLNANDKFRNIKARYSPSEIQAHNWAITSDKAVIKK